MEVLAIAGSGQNRALQLLQVPGNWGVFLSVVMTEGEGAPGEQPEMTLNVLTAQGSSYHRGWPDPKSSGAQ